MNGVSGCHTNRKGDPGSCTNRTAEYLLSGTQEASSSIRLTSGWRRGAILGAGDRHFTLFQCLESAQDRRTSKVESMSSDAHCQALSVFHRSALGSSARHSRPLCAPWCRELCAVGTVDTRSLVIATVQELDQSEVLGRTHCS